MRARWFPSFQRLGLTVHRLGIVVLALAAAACSNGSSPTEPGRANTPPPAPPPLTVGNISLNVVAANPAINTAVPRGTNQHFVTRLRYSPGDSNAVPFFLIARLQQYNGATVEDAPEQYHWTLRDIAGEVRAAIDRTTLNTPGLVRIQWELVLQRPDGAGFVGASFSTEYPIQ